MSTRIQVRRDTAANWTSANPVLTAGEIAFETGTPGKFKIGDGTTAWTSLAYQGGGVSGPSAKPLAVDGTLLREGSTTGPVYRATGYNAHFGTDSYTVGQSLTTYQAMDKYFRQLRPNSLTRLRAYAPGSASPNTGNWSAQLAIYDTVVAAAQANNQRLIFTLTTWGATGNWDLFAPTTVWVTGQQYLHSVAGANSYQDWLQTIVARYKGNYTVAMYDLVNEPVDGGTNTAAFATWFSTASGWIKAIDPNLLVFFGETTGGFASAAYRTVNASMDVCSAHYYTNYGFPDEVSASSELLNAVTLGKPLICDESGIWGKGYYDASDAAPGGQKAISFESQGKFWREQTSRFLARPEVCAVLYYSYMDSDSGLGWNDGAGHFEPINESLTAQAVASLDLKGERFNMTTLGSLSAGEWIEGSQALLWAPGAVITSVLSRTGLIGNAAASGPLASSWQGIPSLLFTGTQYFDSPAWKSADAQGSYWFALVPTATPTTYGYITAPQGTSTNGQKGIRINSAGKVELTVSAITATPTPAGDTIVGTSSNAVNLNDVNTLCVIWNTSASVSNGVAAGYWAIILNGIYTTGTQTKTLTVAFNGRIGTAYDGTSAGFQGHWLQGFMERIAETPVLRAKALAYLSRKYVLGQS